MVDIIALYLGYAILFGSLSLLAVCLWAFVIMTVPHLIKNSICAIRMYYRFLCWHKHKAGIEAWLTTEEGKKIYNRIKNDSIRYNNMVSENDAAMQHMFGE
jgi:hypothetical protein